ncbi:hypothetical protein T492DRAFT_832840 [Pavlovales sp. CCMP2436]|nr:hypothetical protein T492DRAFT_832840 [Pavlovales sp. CCMP2436]
MVDPIAALAAAHPRGPHPNPESTGCAISAAWDVGLAGGCPKFGSWAQNPQFHILSSRTSRVTLELRQEVSGEGKGFGIGLIVLKAEDASGPKLTVTASDLVYFSKPYKSSSSVSATLQLRPRPGGLPYIVIPSTYEPDQLAKFTLSVESDDPDLCFGWLGHASRVFAGSRALGLPSEPGLDFSDAAAPDNEIKVSSLGQALSKNQEKELERLVADATAWCTAHGDRPYEDADFPADSSSVWGGSGSKAGLPDAKVWLRPSQLEGVKAAGKRAALFKPNAEIEGVVQGSGALGNSWLLSACNIVAGQKEAIERAFYHPKFAATQPPHEGAPDRGFYVVGFYHDDPYSEDDWQLVLVDDRIPCDEAGKPLFSRCVSPEVFWVMMVEKAFAKLSKCYANTAGGTVQQGLELLTGGRPRKLDLTDADTLDALTDGASRGPGVDVTDSVQREEVLREHPGLWHELLAALESSPSQVVGCAHKSKVKAAKLSPTPADTAKVLAAGLQPDSVYCIIGGLSYGNKNKKNKLQNNKNITGTRILMMSFGSY